MPILSYPDSPHPAPSSRPLPLRPTRPPCIKLKPFSPPPKPYTRPSSSPDSQGCYSYRALPTDLISSRIAVIFDLAPQDVLYDNREQITAPDILLTGMTIKGQEVVKTLLI